MSDVDQAKLSQLRNIEAKTGRSIVALCAEIHASGKVKHGEVRSWYPCTARRGSTTSPGR